MNFTDNIGIWVGLIALEWSNQYWFFLIIGSGRKNPSLSDLVIFKNILNHNIFCFDIKRIF